MANNVAKVEINGEVFFISLINASDEDELIVLNEIPTENLIPQVESGCARCGETFLTRDSLHNHISRCSKEIDNKKLSKPTDLCFCCEEYLFEAHKGDHACPECDLKFHSEFGLERHKYLLHANNSGFKCNFCNAVGRTIGILCLHKRSHEDLVAPYRCNNCDQNYAYQKCLTNHLTRNLNCGPNNGKTLSCSECNKQFTTLANLQDHIDGEKIFYNRKKFECLYCEKSFCSFRLLDSHGLEHISYPCETCDKKFLGIGYLREHRQTHISQPDQTDKNCNNERKYKCYYCEKTFKFTSQRLRHLVIHTGPKKYKCKICNASFGRLKERNMHMANHFGLRKK